MDPYAKPFYRVTQAIWYVFWVVETALLTRFVLKLVGANPAAPFTDFVYSMSYPLVAPFYNIVPSAVSSANILEWSTLIALAVYWLIAWGLVSLVFMLRPVTTLEARARLHELDLRR